MNRRIIAKREGFTLVELLVVIGIIALLISILLPSLRRARMAAEQVACLNNMKQIVAAMLMWTNDHNGWMVGRSGGGNPGDYVRSNGVIVSWQATNGPPPAKNAVTGSYTDISNWISWERSYDPVTGVAVLANNDDENITYSAIAPYLNAKLTLSSGTGAGGLPYSNAVAPTLDSLFRCPADNIASRPKTESATPPYRYAYSYSANDYVTNPIELCKYSATVPPGYTAQMNSKLANGIQRSNFFFTGKLSSIKNASDILLLVCEDDRTIDDGVFQEDAPAYAAGSNVNAVSDRHSQRKGLTVSALNLTNNNHDALGNVVFCDGHGEFFHRKDALSQAHCGNVYPDPVGFAQLP